MTELTGAFKAKYPNLYGRDWLRLVDVEDQRVFIEFGLKCGDHGRLGGKARAKHGKRNEKGRYIKMEDKNGKIG